MSYRCAAPTATPTPTPYAALTATGTSSSVATSAITSAVPLRPEGCGEQCGAALAPHRLRQHARRLPHLGDRGLVHARDLRVQQLLAPGLG